MLAYALTIFTGAFLLFQVQPIIGKYILPWFGGSPGVWTTCLLFFQIVLLGGYTYAHLISRYLKPRTAAVVHGVLLVVSVALLPITPHDSWKPDGTGSPTLQILALLAANLGLPYLVLSATGPLIQEWARRTHPSASPFRLYALSNAGSLLALGSYPFFFEWMFSRRQQAAMWGWGLVFFALICGFCAWRMKSAARRPGALANLQFDAEPAVASLAPAGRVPPSIDSLSWLALPALASVLLMATTNKLCQDLAVVPFLWVLPLGLYLLSFILCFDSPRWYVRWIWAGLVVVGVAGIAALLLMDDDAPLSEQVIVYSLALFSGCMICHGELYRLKPDPRRLTSYYLMIAAGGALGGVLVAVVAPHVFNSFAELPISYWFLTVMIATIAVRDRSLALGVGVLAGAVIALFVLPGLSVAWEGSFRTSVRHYAVELGKYGRDYRWWIAGILGAAVLCYGHWRQNSAQRWSMRAAAFMILVSGILGYAFCVQAREARVNSVSASRNFFGMLTVFQYGDEPEGEYNLLLHGKITHGMQFTDRAKSTWPTSYYGRTSGVGRAIGSLPGDRGRKIGLVGLGTGTLAAYGRKADTIRIYEINPAVEALAQSRFTYVPHSPARVEIVHGDARLSMEQELARGEPQNYDVLALDAFNSDAIPVHLLTREAFAVYLRHLKPDGIIAVHISNRYFDLQPVVTNLARNFGLAAVTIDDDDKGDWWIYDTTWMLMARDPKVLDRAAIAKGATKPYNRMEVPLWTDDYTALFKILK
jgi:SAM-dependent methyltransferase